MYVERIQEFAFLGAPRAVISFSVENWNNVGGVVCVSTCEKLVRRSLR